MIVIPDIHVSEYARQQKYEPKQQEIKQKWAEENIINEARVQAENFPAIRLTKYKKDQGARNGAFYNLSVIASTSGPYTGDKITYAEEKLKIFNPETGRAIDFNSTQHKKLIKQGLMPPLI